ncbi:hypothetical protein I79_018390 [Cricetulus griseus]|uniref:Uncharacterized protein n=1 Tax=Cricetulus griseus TaxID=10029 RepID=G3I4K8_CRIGR|nr:hypothetical protein I79_018390 [Cricetulus griseus]
MAPTSLNFHIPPFPRAHRNSTQSYVPRFRIPSQLNATTPRTMDAASVQFTQTLVQPT